MDITELFNNAPNYVVLRHSTDFPVINQGQDVDILVKDIPTWVEHIKDFSRPLPGKLVSYQLTPKHHQVDYYHKGFRHKYDLYSELISPAFTDDIFKTSRIIRDMFFVPNIDMDRLTKAFELRYHGKTKYSDYYTYIHGLSEYL